MVVVKSSSELTRSSIHLQTTVNIKNKILLNLIEIKSNNNGRFCRVCGADLFVNNNIIIIIIIIIIIQHGNNISSTVATCGHM